MHPISQLIIKYNRGEITPEERQLLLDWVSENPERGLLFNSLTERDLLREQLAHYQEYDEVLLLDRLNRLKTQDGSAGVRQDEHSAGQDEYGGGQYRGGQQDGVRYRRVLQGGMRYRRVLMAAAVLLLVITGGGFWFFLHRSVTPLPVQQPTAMVGDVAPGGNKAVLTLAGGQHIILDSAANGLLAEQGQSRVQKLADGRLVYDRADNAMTGGATTGNAMAGGATAGGATAGNATTGNATTGNATAGGATGGGAMVGVSYNTLSVPRGGQYRIGLPDGTQVWLNAASSITYPTAFPGKDRVVTVTGEAYFEVAADAGKPFMVRVGELAVRVLGTRFDIGAYSDEPSVNTTLLQGGVEVEGRGRRVVLKPGQQAQVVNGAIAVTPVSDLESVTAWKDGNFKFSQTPLKEIMRQLQRWYDVDVSYDSPVEGLTFSGRMPRREYVSQVLKMLEETGVGHFKIEGKTIKVSR